MTQAKEKEIKSERTGARPAAVESLLTSAEIKTIRDDLERERELRIRALADFDNYRRRVERERGAAERSGKRAIILTLLDMMDDFDRALEHVDQSPDVVVEGLRAVRKRLAEALKSEGVMPFESVGQQFNPMFHEAVGVIEAGASKAGIAIEPGSVTDETRRGYRWDGVVLRPARVQVAK